MSQSRYKTAEPPYAPPPDLQPMGSIPTSSDKDFRCPDCNGTGQLPIQKVPGNITGKFGMVETPGIRDDLPEATIINPFGGFEAIPCIRCLGSGQSK